VNHGQHHKGIGHFAGRRHRYATEGQIAEEGTIRLGGDRREAIRLLLRSLSYTVDEGKGSHAQLVVRINADSPIAEEIAEEARGAGTSVTVK
jgi:hypothetical protein